MANTSADKSNLKGEENTEEIQETKGNEEKIDVPSPDHSSLCRDSTDLLSLVLEADSDTDSSDKELGPTDEETIQTHRVNFQNCLLNISFEDLDLVSSLTRALGCSADPDDLRRALLGLVRSAPALHYARGKKTLSFLLELMMRILNRHPHFSFLQERAYFISYVDKKRNGYIEVMSLDRMMQQKKKQRPFHVSLVHPAIEATTIMAILDSVDLTSFAARPQGVQMKYVIYLAYHLGKNYPEKTFCRFIPKGYFLPLDMMVARKALLRTAGSGSKCLATSALKKYLPKMPFDNPTEKEVTDIILSVDPEYAEDFIELSAIIPWESVVDEMEKVNIKASEDFKITFK